MITHKKQTTKYSCGACSFAMIVGVSEERAMELCGTKKSGTNTSNVVDAFEALKYQVHLVDVKKDFNKCWWLHNIHYPMYVSGFYKTRYCKRGRPRQRDHAFVIYNGNIYDPAENDKLPIEAYSDFDTLKIKRIIIVEKKLDESLAIPSVDIVNKD